MKQIFRIATLVLMVIALAACAKPTEAPVATEAPVVATEAPVVAPTEIPLSANEQWAKDNGLGIYQPATDDWAAIEAAAKAEGSVVIYSNSSRIAAAG